MDHQITSAGRAGTSLDRRDDRSAADADADSDASGFLAIYRETVEPLYAYVARRTGGTRELAEDVVQETYLRAVRAWSAGPAPDDALAWLQTVARNLIVSQVRRRRPTSVDPATLEQALAEGDGGTATMPAIAARAIVWGLSRMPPDAARLLESFHLDGKPVRRIARETGLSERAVEGRLQRARRRLQRELKRLRTEREPRHER